MDSLLSRICKSKQLSIFDRFVWHLALRLSSQLVDFISKVYLK